MKSKAPKVENPTSFISNESLNQGAEQESSSAKRKNRLSIVLWRFISEVKWMKKFLPLSLILMILASSAPSFFRWYTGKLTEIGQTRTLLNSHYHLYLSLSVGGLFLIAFSGALLRILAWAFFELTAMWSAQGLHARMVDGLASTRTTYFDENPSGRLINRLVRDYEEVRFHAVIEIGDALNALAEILSVSVLTYLIQPALVLLTFPLFAIFAYVQYHRGPMMKHAKAMAAVCTSQLLHRQTDLIEGRSIFLIYNKMGLLLTRLRASFLESVHARALVFRLDLWSSFWLKFTTGVFSTTVLLVVCYSLQTRGLEPTLAGVIISALFGISSSMEWMNRSTSQLSSSLTHVERVFEFCDLKKEESEERKEPQTSKIKQSPSQPEGDLIFLNYSMSYRKDSPLILNSLNFTVPYQSKTAIIGRTGAGKTSLAQALLRMVYVQAGDIRIGNQSIYDLELNLLRRQFGVVPQAPYLFAGTIESNLDRCQELPRAKLQRALDQVGSKQELSFKVEEGGRNLSQGQRQLLCLARVIAHERKIILLDEPTSGLDPETDAQLAQALENTLKNQTLITIAHRTESLKSYDQIIELHQGQIQRMGPPSEIL